MSSQLSGHGRAPLKRNAGVVSGAGVVVVVVATVMLCASEMLRFTSCNRNTPPSDSTSAQQRTWDWTDNPAHCGSNALALLLPPTTQCPPPSQACEVHTGLRSSKHPVWRATLPFSSEAVHSRAPCPAHINCARMYVTLPLQPPLSTLLAPHRSSRASDVNRFGGQPISTHDNADCAASSAPSPLDVLGSRPVSG